MGLAHFIRRTLNGARLCEAPPCAKSRPRGQPGPKITARRPGHQVRPAEKGHKNGWAIALGCGAGQIHPPDSEWCEPLWGAFGWVFLCAAVPVAYFWHTESPSKGSRHSESGRRSWPAPAPKAIAHPFLCPFSAGRTWRPGLRAVIFGRGFGRGLFLTHGGPSQILAAFRVQRRKLASPTLQGYSPPVFVAFFRWTNLAPRPSGSYFWTRLCPRPIFGTRRPLAKSHAIPSPADEVGKPHPPRV